MSTSNDVEIMKHKWESLRITGDFSRVHHQSSDKFKSKPPSLKRFYNWCQEHEIQDENIQTLNRALKTASLVEQGQHIDSAIESAWKLYPIINR